jgi:activator of HSP90 ATPase
LTESLEVSITLPATAQAIFLAWMSSNDHSQFTGSPAIIDPGIGGKFSAWDGYIQGVTCELNPNVRIVQSWRTSDFPSGSPDSRLEINLKEFIGETLITLVHTNLPDGQADEYREGWRDFYFKPMMAYFSATPG